ncbi:MAG: hypothetical protein Q7U68_03825 [Candidatus Roizmanbacteria bacterium]|nr:hypothetical protein [Candidatus Roizmanbacteria bacterium]
MKLFNNKSLIIILILLILGLVYYIYKISNLTKIITLPPYTFYDSAKEGSDGLVTAEGSWISTNSDLAFPLSTMNIECWKKYGNCWIADATIFKYNYLSSGLNLKEIKYWNNDFIETKPSIPLLKCVEETYRIDRRSETVTYIRKTINQEGLCEGYSKEPITAILDDGLKRIELYEKNK